MTRQRRGAPKVPLTEGDAAVIEEYEMGRQRCNFCEHRRRIHEDGCGECGVPGCECIAFDEKEKAE